MTIARTPQDTTRRALHEVQRYLADEIAPLLAADAFAVLLRLPPALVATTVGHWLEAQLRAPDRAATVSGYLYHAITKLHVFSEFDLLDRRAVQRYLAELIRLVVQMCPDHERAELRAQLARLGSVETILSEPVKLLNREKGSDEFEDAVRCLALEKAAPAPEGAPAREPKGRVLGSGAARAEPVDPALVLQRLNVILRQIHDARRPGGEGGDASALEILAHLVSRAVAEAGDGRQLEAFLDRVPGFGVARKFDRRMFRLLGDRLPGWELDAAAALASDPGLGRVTRAMHRIVALAPSGEEGIERFGEMVYAAIEKLNEGHLAQAVAMLDVADRLVDERKIDPERAREVRVQSQGAVSLSPLRQFASTPAKHGLLRRVLRFFPEFHPETLLARLDGEPRRETRKLLLALVEVHGPPCRPRILDRLVRYLAGELPDPSGFYSRNAVFLLRRVPRGAEPGAEPEREIELLAELSRPVRPLLLVKEALAALALEGVPLAARVLSERLDDFEREALGGRGAYPPADLVDLMDRACAALARVGTKDAVRRVARHALQSDPLLGETLARIQHLAGTDLGGDPEQLLSLLEALRSVLPGKVLGLVLGPRGPEPRYLVRALSGTRHPLVERLLEEIAARFPGRDLGDDARAALTKRRSRQDPEAAPARTISGDLDVFGLPTLFQSLAESGSSGRLVLTETNGVDRGVVFFRAGRISGCEVGKLRGLDAVCQMFERPREGAFCFERAEVEPSAPSSEEPLEVLPTVLEAIRRHDEFQGDRALVPDGASLGPTGTAPELPPEEEDREFVRVVWREASRGTAPESCEGHVRGDAYRVRRLYAHWFEQGALERRRAA